MADSVSTPLDEPESVVATPTSASISNPTPSSEVVASEPSISTSTNAINNNNTQPVVVELPFVTNVHGTWVDWLIENELGQYVSEFKKQKVDEEMFYNLTNDDLIALKVNNLGERKIILAFISESQGTKQIKHENSLITNLEGKVIKMQAQIEILTIELKRVASRLEQTTNRLNVYDNNNAPPSQQQKLQSPSPSQQNQQYLEVQSEHSYYEEPVQDRNSITNRGNIRRSVGKKSKSPKKRTPKHRRSGNTSPVHHPVISLAFGRSTNNSRITPRKDNERVVKSKRGTRSPKKKVNRSGKKIIIRNVSNVSNLNVAQPLKESHSPLHHPHSPREIFKVGRYKFSYAIEELRDVDYKVAFSAPAKTLKLDHVYGYNGRDSRDNIHFLKTDEYIYHVAAVVIIANPKTNSQRFYCSHTDDILSLTINNKRTLVASGQKDPRGKKLLPFISVWEPRSLREVFRFHHHERGVGIVAFTPDNRFLLSIGLDDNHQAALWNVGPAARRAAQHGLQQRPRLLGRLGNDDVEAIFFDPSFTDHSTKQNVFYYRFVVIVKNSYPKFFTLIGGRGEKDRVELKQLISNPLKKKDNKALIDRKFASACFLKSGVCVVGGHSGTLYFTDRNLSCVVAIMRPCDKAPITCLHEYRWQGQTRVLAADANGVIAGIQMTIDDVKSLHVEAEELFTVETKHHGIRAMDVKRNVVAFGCPFSILG